MSWTRRIAAAWGDESGQTLPFAAVCFAILIGFLGLAIDVGHLRDAKRQLQTAADAVAYAAGLELRVCGAANPCTTMATAAQSALIENGFATATVVYNCAARPSTLFTLSLNKPPCALGTSDPNAGKTNYLEVQLQKPVRTFFMGAFGFKTVNLSARAEVRHGGGPCVYALDTTGAGAITAAASITTTCSIVDESTNSSAFSCAVGTIAAPQITVAGGSSKLLCTTSPKAHTGAPIPTPADPLKYLATPPIPACGASTGGVSGSTTTYHGYNSPLLPLPLAAGTFVLYPDKAYCGGISIAATAKVTFMPGTYVIKSTAATNGGLSISLLASVTGTGVTFYNYGPYGGLSMVGTGLSSMSLIAPTTGSYSGILYFQDSGNSTSATVSASSTGTTIQGGFYLPSASLGYLLATPSPYTILVAKDISFLGALTLKGDFSSLATTSPLNADNVQLVE